MDRDEENKNNPLNQEAPNETETESTATDAPSADHNQEDLSEEKEIEAEYTEVEETANEEEPIVEPAASTRPTMNKEERSRVYNSVSETEEIIETSERPQKFTDQERHRRRIDRRRDGRPDRSRLAFRDGHPRQRIRNR